MVGGAGLWGGGSLSKDRRLLEQKDLFREMQTCCAWSRGAEPGSRRPKSRQRPDGGGKLSQGAAAYAERYWESLRMSVRSDVR